MDRFYPFVLHVYLALRKQRCGGNPSSNRPSCYYPTTYGRAGLIFQSAILSHSQDGSNCTCGSGSSGGFVFIGPQGGPGLLGHRREKHREILLPELLTRASPVCCRWIIHAMEYELQIRGGDQPAADLYRLSPSEVKQLLLDILQPPQHGRY